jgi:dTDP-glucose 4,6-dehydratase/UDP-glucose 4-epimerase
VERNDMISSPGYSGVDYSDARILITGGMGFIGSNLARRLVSLGAHVTLMDSLIPEYGGNPRNVSDLEGRVSLEIADVRDPEAVRRLVEGKDFLFNLAGQTSHLDSMTDPYTDLDINAAAQLSILEACRAMNPEIKLVFASTRQLYGRPDYLPVDESHPVRPIDVNGINKLAGEWYHLLYNEVYGIRACALRLTNTYGPGMRVRDARQTFLGIWVRQLIEGTPIKVYGDGEQKRDFTYVDDCVDALLMAASSNSAYGKVFNLGSDEVVRLSRVAEMMCSLSPGSSFELVPFPGDRKRIDIGDYYADTRLVEEKLGWRPQIDLAEGLRRTVDFYRANSSYYWDAS